MKRESIYISLPLSGLDESVQREKAEQISTMLSEMGYLKIINPFRIGDWLKASINREPTYEEYMQSDLEVLKRCDAIFMCVGWDGSSGCRRKRNKAVNHGQEIIYEL